MDYCINHTSERAVGRCGTCQRPACYRCSLTIDQVIYCSTACFNERPAKAKAPAPVPAPAPAPAPAAAALADEFSDVVAAIDARVSAAERAALTEPSVVLSAHLADDNSGSTMLGLTPVPGLARDGSSTLIMAGTRRALLSSSCFFHPDTSAIVLCVKCRNPICTLCAKESPEGLTCSPACGPPDLVGVRERRQVTLVNVAIVGAILFVLAESGVVLWASRNADLQVATLKVGGSRDTDVRTTDPELRRADALLKEATTLLRDAADGAELGRRTGTDTVALTSWFGRAVGKLKQARELYSSRAGESPDPELKRRIDNVAALLDGLRIGEPAPDPVRPPNAAQK
jgi:hypothetical protein